MLSMSFPAVPFSYAKFREVSRQKTLKMKKYLPLGGYFQLNKNMTRCSDDAKIARFGQKLKKKHVSIHAILLSQR